MIRVRTHTVVIVALAFLEACRPAPTSIGKNIPASGVAPVNQIQLYYESHGEGTPLILLHGGLGNTGVWRYQTPTLSEHCRVITVDSRGHGRSTFSEQQMSYALMASDVIALMDYLSIDRTNILGWSDGGNIALHLAIHHPDRLNQVIVYGANYDPSGVRPDFGESEKMIDYIENAAKEYQALSPDPTRWDAFLENMERMWTAEPHFTAEQLDSVTVPVLVLYGDHDEVIYTEHTKEMARLIPTAKLTLIPGTGHFALWEKPDEFNSAVLELLAQSPN